MVALAAKDREASTSTGERRGKKVGEGKDALLALSRLPISLVKKRRRAEEGTVPGKAGGGCGVRAFPSG